MRWLVLYVLMLCCIGNPYAQQWHMPEGKLRSEIPFTLVNHLIIVSLQLNGEPLSFLLDNGVKETLLFGYVDSLRLRNTSSLTFQGFGVGKPIEGMVSKDNIMKIGELVDSAHYLYVVTDTAFNLSKNIGIPIHGILGSSFFRNNVVAIDYIKHKIKVAKDVSHLNLKIGKYKSLELEIDNDRSYQRVDLLTSENIFDNQKLLIDLGNSDPFMLFHDMIPEFDVHPPSIYEYLGYGFNGAVYGLKNRIRAVNWGDILIQNPIVSYPDSSTYERNRIAKGRVGSIGNQVLSRFYVILDYPRGRLYLRPNKHLNKPYVMDMSGLEIVHDGFEFVRHRAYRPTKKEVDGSTTIKFSTEVNYIIELHSTYEIEQVRPNSPAEKAGLAIGDILVKINGRPVGKMKLPEIKHRLQAGQDKQVRLQVYRGDQLLNITFRLMDPLVH